MKKRLKELLALCMAGIMVFAMTTGFAAADDTPANTVPAKAEYTGIGAVNQIQEFYPGDVISSDSTGGSSGVNFTVGQYVPMGKNGAGIPELDWTHFTTNTGKDSRDYNGVYRCWNTDNTGDVIKWEDYAVLLGWYEDIETDKYWFEVDEDRLSARAEELINNYMLLSYEYSTYRLKYNFVTDSEGNPVMPFKYQEEKAEPGQPINPKASFTFQWFSSDKEVCLYDNIITTGFRYALKLPTAKELYGDTFSDYGYHYNLKAIQKSAIRDAESPDGVPTGIMEVSDYKFDDEGNQIGEKIKDELIDVTWTCKPDDYDYQGFEEPSDAQVNVMLIFESIKPNTYTVNFDSNGGEGTMDSYTQKYTNSDKDNLPENKFTKTGYSFAGWKIKDKPSYTESGTSGAPITIEIKDENENIKAPYQEVYEDQAHYTPSRNNETVTLEAQWTANKYTVKYDANTGTGNMDVQELTYGKEEPLSENKFTKEGYTFKEWNTEADGTGTAYKDKAEVKNLRTEEGAEITLYAQWTANDYTVKFEANGGSESMADQKLTYDETATLNENKFVKTGYTFTGWNTKADGTETPYNDKAEVKNLTTEKDAKVTLYAQWTANDYTVKFDTDGGSAIDDKTVKWEDNVLADVEDPTKDGFTFKGWKYGEADVTADTTYSALAEDDAIEELILTAQWEEVVVPVDEPDDKSPTGDNMNITLLMALLLLSGCGIAGAGLYRRNHVK